MSDMGTTLDILGTDPRSFPAVLLLRTIAIYSGSKRVAIPLTIGYVVCPQGKRLGSCNQSYLSAGIRSGWNRDELLFFPRIPW